MPKAGQKLTFLEEARRSDATAVAPWGPRRAFSRSRGGKVAVTARSAHVRAMGQLQSGGLVVHGGRVPTSPVCSGGDKTLERRGQVTRLGQVLHMEGPSQRPISLLEERKRRFLASCSLHADCFAGQLVRLARLAGATGAVLHTDRQVPRIYSSISSVKAGHVHCSNSLLVPRGASST